MSILNFAYSLNAAADFSTAGQQRFVTIDASGDAALSSAGGDSEGVLQNNPILGASGTIWRGGISSVEAGAAVSIGDNIASDATGRGVPAIAGDAILGVAKEAAGAAGVFFDMVQTDRSDVGNGALSNAIADPGDGNAIPVTQNGHVVLVSGGAETRTLADPTFKGQTILVFMDTDGGDIVLTTASAANAAGDNTFLFDAIGEVAEFTGTTRGAAFFWSTRVDGATPSTV